MVLLIDNYDSFTFNLAQYLGELGAEVSVRRNDQITLDGIAALAPSRIVISPGPGRPEDAGISIATVYRTVRLFEEASILDRHDFGDKRARYEQVPDQHHDHLIDIQSRRVIEFQSPEIEELQRRIATQHGYRLVGHRLELYAVPLVPPTDKRK